LLCRLAKKYKLNPHLKQTIQIWWDNTQEWLLEAREKDDAEREHSAALLAELEKNGIYLISFIRDDVKLV